MTARYDEVRRRLVERGYLRGPIERFVLREATSPGGAARAIARGSAKAALLAAPLLGALLAAGTLAANRPLLGARDGLVLWAYFAVLAAAALFVLDVAAAALASLWSRGRAPLPADAIRAGLLVAAPVLLYLVILQARGGSRTGPLADLLFLAGALAATTFAAWLAGLVSLAGIVGRTGEVPARTRRAAALVAGVLLPIGALLFLLPSSRAREGSVPPSTFPAPVTAGPALLLAVDGLDGDLVERLEPSGAIRTLLETIASGSVFPKRSEPAREPAEVWTTIMTGVGPDEHGVRSAGLARLPGIAGPIAPGYGPAAFEAALRFLLPSRTVPVSGAARRVRSLWEIAALVHPTVEVGFWSSWPARGIEGDARGSYVVSDRLLAKLLASAPEDRDVEPESLFARCAQEFPADRDALRAAFDARFAAIAAETRAVAWESLLIDGFAWRTAQRLRSDPAVAFTFVYLPGLDILRSRLKDRAGDPAAAVVETYVRWLDETIVADAAAATGTLLLLTDPGRTAAEAAEGFVLVRGAKARAACVGPPVADLDVAPIVLRALGLPASREMPGRVPAACLAGADDAPPAIATWGRRGSPALVEPSAYDPEMVERLKSLGYLR